MVQGDLRAGAVIVVSTTLFFLVSPPRYGDTTLVEGLFDIQMSAASEIAVTGLAVALPLCLFAYRRIPSDPDDREWIPEE
jgi:hypothetical protein